jgi:hypothetical protein
MSFTVLLGPQPELSASDKAQRARRAREVLTGADWLFNEFISEQTKTLLDSATVEAREGCHRLITAAAGVKAHLIRIIETQEAEDTRNERRDRKPE